MNWGRHGGDRAGPYVRTAALLAAALAITAQLTMGNAASYASDPNAGPTSAQVSAGSSPPFSSTSPAAGNPTPTRTQTSPPTRPRIGGAAAASPYLVLSASSLDAARLTYLGVFTVTRPTGDVDVLRFTLDGGSLTGLSFAQACSSGDVTTVTAAGSASLGGTTFDAVSLTVTVGGQTVTFTVADPPAAPFPNRLLLHDVALTGTTLSTDRFSTPSFSTEAATC